MARRQKTPRGTGKEGGQPTGGRAYIRRLRIARQQERSDFDGREILTRRGVPLWGRTLIVAAVALILMLVLFRVREFQVEGSVRYTAEEVAEASGVGLGDLLLGVNKTQAASRILVRLPYVRQVVVSRSLPGTVRFQVTECRAMAAAESATGAKWLMNSDGKLLERVEGDERLGYPVIRGAILDLPNAGDLAAFQNENRGQAALTIARAVQQAGLEQQVTAIDVSSVSLQSVTWEDRVEVLLGDGKDLDYRLQYMLAALERLPEDARGQLDLSFPEEEQAVFHPLS